MTRSIAPGFRIPVGTSAPARSSGLEGGVVVLPSTDGLHVVEPVAFVLLGRPLHQVARLTLGRGGDAPCLALVRPVVRVEPVGLAPPPHGAGLVTAGVGVAAELETRRGFRLVAP